MMVTATLLLLLTTVIYSQQSEFITRHCKSNTAIIFHLGGTDMSKLANVGYSRYWTKDWFSDVQFQYEMGTLNLTDFQDFSLTGNLHYNFYSWRKTLYCNASISAFVGQEFIKEQIFDNKKNSFAYGIGIGPNMEYFISNKFCLLLNVNQNFVRGSSIRDAYLSAEIGFRYFLNN